MPDSDNILDEENDVVLKELSEYLSVLGNEIRLKILKVIEKEPMDAMTIARILHGKWDMEVTIPNTKRHLKKLIGIGVVTKYPVLKVDKGGEDGKKSGPKIVMCYKYVSGSFDAVLSNLNVLSGYISKADTIICIEEITRIDKTIEKILNEFSSKSKLMLLDGGDIVREYPLEKKIVQIGRIHPTENDISLPDTDRTVGRKQSRIIYESGRYYLEDIGSKNGTYLKGRQQEQFVKLKQDERKELNDGDIIRLGLLNTIFVFRRGRV